MLFLLEDNSIFEKELTIGFFFRFLTCFLQHSGDLLSLLCLYVCVCVVESYFMNCDKSAIFEYLKEYLQLLLTFLHPFSKSCLLKNDYKNRKQLWLILAFLSLFLINKNGLNWGGRVYRKEEERMNKQCIIFLTLGLVTKCGEKYMLHHLFIQVGGPHVLWVGGNPYPSPLLNLVMLQDPPPTLEPSCMHPSPLCLDS